MKKTLFIIAFFAAFVVNAQDAIVVSEERSWLENWTNFKPQAKEYREATQILSGNIDANTKLTKDKVYVLFGTVRVIKNAVLTIEAGTVIRGDYDTNGALMITKGAKIMAAGTVTDPIIFTSNKKTSERKAGDWGGLLILGNAPLNTINNSAFGQFTINIDYNGYGGTNEQDNSGVLKYVRIEFAGKKDVTGYSPNGISLLGVGSKTLLEYIAISYSFDDSMQIYGGKVKLSNIVSFYAKDDDFDITQGAQVDINNGLIIRNPFVSDILGSRGFELDNFVNKEYYDGSKKSTLIKLNNVTVASVEKENDAGLAKQAIYLSENTLIEINNSVISGFDSMVCMENNFFLKENYKKVVINNLILNKVNNVVTEKEFVFENKEAVQNFIDINTAKGKITNKNLSSKELFVNPDVKNNPNFKLK